LIKLGEAFFPLRILARELIAARFKFADPRTLFCRYLFAAGLHLADDFSKTHALSAVALEQTLYQLVSCTPDVVPCARVAIPWLMNAYNMTTDPDEARSLYYNVANAAIAHRASLEVLSDVWRAAAPAPQLHKGEVQLLALAACGCGNVDGADWVVATLGAVDMSARHYASYYPVRDYQDLYPDDPVSRAKVPSRFSVDCLWGACYLRACVRGWTDIMEWLERDEHAPDLPFAPADELLVLVVVAETASLETLLWFERHHGALDVERIACSGLHHTHVKAIDEHMQDRYGEAVLAAADHAHALMQNAFRGTTHVCWI
jgi:hypothetical protein